MVGIDKNKLGSNAKGDEEPKKVIKPTTSATMGNKALKDVKITYAVPPGTLKKAPAGPTEAAKDSMADFKAAQEIKKQLEVLHSKTHQDLINAAYKAAETLKIAPFVLLRAAGWGNFTDDRGKKYSGKAIDELEGLDAAQKKALKDVLGL